jgi:NAD(P)-dependent dehydrogenase (short-subunit alcohol dehydrogenase family)
MGILNGKTIAITGAGGGLGREHALLVASEGANVIVNDLGGSVDGQGDDKAPAQKVVEEIISAGGKAVANIDNIATIEGAQNLLESGARRISET